jgi:hypothetical protein
MTNQYPSKTLENRLFRTAMAIDRENASRTGRPTETDAETLHWHLSNLFPVQTHFTVVAVNPGNALAGQRLVELTNGALRCRHGENGADLELFDFLKEIPENNRRHPKCPITSIRLVSGDGIFIPVIRQLRQSNVHVTVIGHRNCFHHGLYRVADRVIILNDRIQQLQAAA